MCVFTGGVWVRYKVSITCDPPTDYMLVPLFKPEVKLISWCGNEQLKLLNTFIVSTWSLTPALTNQTDSICPNNTMCPVIMLIVLRVDTLLLHSEALSHHYTITVLNEVNNSQTEDALSAVWLIKWSNMWITQSSIMKSLSRPHVYSPPPHDVQSQLWPVLLLCMVERFWLQV